MTRATTDRFSDLVRAHHAAVYRAALRVTQHVDDAADAAQQAFVVALEQGGRLLRTEHPERVVKWLAVKQALMILRQRRRQRARELATAMTPDATRGDPSDAAEHLEQRQLTRAALRTLPGDVRLALELRFGEDMTFNEIAQAQDVSEPTAFERVQRGLERLRARLRASAGAILAVDLEALVRDGTRLPSAAVPAGLESKLLALSAQSAGSTLALLPWLVTSGVLLTAFVIVPRFFGDAPAQSARTAPTIAAAPQNSNAASPLSDSVRKPIAAPDPGTASQTPITTIVPPATTRAPLTHSTGSTATLHGRVVHADGRRLESVRISAASVVRDGKASQSGAIALVRDDGTFDLDVEVSNEPDEDFELFVEYETSLVFKAPTIRLRPGEQRTLDPFVVTLDIPSKPADWTIDATLIAPDRAIPVGTWVSVWRCVPTIYGADHDATLRESAAQTTADGRALLKGSWLGKTRLELEVVADTTLDRYAVEFVIESSGALQRTFTLPEPTRWIDTQPDDGVGGFEPPPAIDSGTIVAHVRDADGQPLLRADHDVEAWPANELDVEAIAFDLVPNRLFRDACQVAFMGAPPETDLEHLTGLKPGRYVVIAYDSYSGPNFAPGITAPITVSLTKPSDVTVTLATRCTLEGSVRDVDGKGLAGAVLMITGQGPITDERVAAADAIVRASGGKGTYSFDCTRSDAAGDFTFDGVPPAVTLRVVALHPEREPAFSEFATLAARGEIRNLAVSFTKRRPR